MDCRRCSCCHLIYASVSIFYHNKIIFCVFLIIVVRLKNKKYVVVFAQLKNLKTFVVQWSRFSGKLYNVQ